jgi:hypothetical protein
MHALFSYKKPRDIVEAGISKLQESKAVIHKPSFKIGHTRSYCDNRRTICKSGFQDVCTENCYHHPKHARSSSRIHKAHLACVIIIIVI